ncbi:MAG TPA: NAD-dependent epimerase/dehydratase family protein [Ignavibacteriaceae bacterium]|jgi:UDP-glucose 4-epimerase|nr:NAD-dependent epimerase/dehydratase family protein [Ignavibacteriaceae bacterium]HOJ18842.1 NAD-dependent epimerase/dehydratase family protein [Ignavibacteriaceae bacterium]HPO55693.1 NAD-dependent epimerase/dehydratase family protein [Ignavibacteriaceae bacterium]
MKEKVVITGGAGFIGSHLAEGWLSRGAETVIIDNFRSGKRENLKVLRGHKLVEGSITDKELMREVLSGVDYVYNLAALISVPESVENPFECVEINVRGLLNILEAARENGVKRVIHFSSAAVYGDNPATPKTTDMKPEPKSPYGITKLDGEYYLSGYRENYGLSTLSFRCFNVFGPRQDPASQYAAAIPIFVNKAIKNEEITIYGDGEQTRDFIFVKDIVSANLLAAEKKEVTGVYNLGTSKSVSINELTELTLRLTNSKSKVVYREERAGDIKHSLSSIEETRKALGFEPAFDLTEGLKETINYFIQLFKGYEK